MVRRLDGSIPCLVLAGGTPRPGEPLYDETRGRPKADLEIGGRAMVQWVLDALGESGVIGPVVLVGLEEPSELAYTRELITVGPRGSLADNLFAGIERLLELDPAATWAAYSWSDIPLATGEMMRHFAERATNAANDTGGADVVAGLVERSALEARFPAVREEWLKLREGRFVAADFGVFDPSVWPRREGVLRGPLEVLTGQRKSAFRQARTVGLGLLVRYLLGRLSIPVLERTLERRYGVRARVLVTEDAELGLDVDGKENLAICRSLLSRVDS